MAFDAKLIMATNGVDITHRSGADEDGLAVLQCTFNFSMPYDPSTDYTHGRVRAGLIHIDMESSKNPAFIQWLVQNQRGEGKVIFYTTDNHGARVEDIVLVLENARLVEYRETFDSTNDVQMTSHLEIFAHRITINDEVASESFQWIDD